MITLLSLWITNNLNLHNKTERYNHHKFTRLLNYNIDVRIWNNFSIMFDVVINSVYFYYHNDIRCILSA